MHVGIDLHSKYNQQNVKNHMELFYKALSIDKYSFHILLVLNDQIIASNQLFNNYINCFWSESNFKAFFFLTWFIN